MRRYYPVILLMVLFALPVNADGGSFDWAWQNPFMAANPFNNIHNDSWFTDTYTFEGPKNLHRVKVEMISNISFNDPISGDQISWTLGECPAHTYDSEDNLVTVCSGLPNLQTNVFNRSIVSFSPEGKLLAWISFEVPFTNLREALTEFGGIGYFYLDNEDRLVMGMPDGHVITWARKASDVSPVDTWIEARNVNVTGKGGPVPPALGDFYSMVPNASGFTWFTTSEGVVGTIAPDGCEQDCVKWIDLNNPDGDDVRDPQPDGGLQKISESHSVNGNSTFQQTNYKMYRLDMKPDGTPVIAWEKRYRRGVRVKPGQTSRGSGTSPVYFEMAGREFVTIMDNAIKPNINIYRAESRLNVGESRLFAQAAPFGNNRKVSDENSLIVYPGTRWDSRRIYGENNWGNTSLLSTAGPFVTRPGFGGVEVFANGRIRVIPENKKIRVPSLVSKASIPSNALYTYNKRVGGWYLTALDPDDPRQVLWTTQVGSGHPKYNNWYAQMSLAPGGRTIVVGVTLGLMKVTAIPGPKAPKICFSVPEPRDFITTMRTLAEHESGPVLYPEYLRAAFVGWAFDFFRLSFAAKDYPIRGEQLRELRKDQRKARRILSAIDFDATLLSAEDGDQLREIADGHEALIEELADLFASNCE